MKAACCASANLFQVLCCNLSFPSYALTHWQCQLGCDNIINVIINLLIRQIHNVHTTHSMYNEVETQKCTFKRFLDHFNDTINLLNTNHTQSLQQTRDSASAEEPRDALCQLKYYGRFLTDLLTRSSANAQEPCDHTVSWNRVKRHTNVRWIAFENVCKQWMTFKVI